MILEKMKEIDVVRVDTPFIEEIHGKNQGDSIKKIQENTGWDGICFVIL